MVNWEIVWFVWAQQIELCIVHSILVQLMVTEEFAKKIYVFRDTLYSYVPSRILF
jgi:hypothetical protein